MTTGIEPLLGPALAKTAGIGVARVGGWGTAELLSIRRRRKIRSLIHSKARAPHLEALAALPPEQLAAVQRFCESPEVEHAATALTRAYLLERAGKKADKLVTSVKEELNLSLALYLETEPSDLLKEVIFNAISEAVLGNVSRLLSRPKLSNEVEAELIATAGSLAAAGVRNTELLKGLKSLTAINAFESDYKSQAAALHATMRLPHAGTTRQVPYNDLFVEPQVWIDGLPESENEDGPRVAVDYLLRCRTRVVILGDPGGGKSTLARKLMFDLAADWLPELSGKAPFFVELRDYAGSVRGRSRRTLVEHLEHICRSPYNVEPPPDAIEYLLLNNRAVVIFDGLDELLDVSLRRDVVEAVEGFVHRYPTCPIVVTSRRIGYDEAPLSEQLFSKVALSQFTPPQVEDYVRKWFHLDESIDGQVKDQLATSFLVDSEFVTDLRVNPLMLSLMCGIYASENYIPRNRPDVYEKCALLLFERWDKQRGIVAELSFDAHVQAALRALALHMYDAQLQAETLGEASDEASEGMPRTDLIQFLTGYLREKRFDNDEDAETAAVQFVDFCKGRAWVLTDVGAETYGFTHRTFLEYFAASQLVRLNTSAKSLYGVLRESIRTGSSDVVAQLAVQILGRATEDGADDFLQLVISDCENFSAEDVNGISFCARSLSFIVPKPEILKEICAKSAGALLATKPRRNAARGYRRYILDQHPVANILACSLENAPRVASTLREILVKVLDASRPPEAAFILALFPPSPDEGRLEEYWAAWSKDNVSLFHDAIVSAIKRFYWLGVLQYERGELTLEELLGWHDVASLYEFRMSGYSAKAPFVYRIVRTSRGGGYLGLHGWIKRGRRQEIVSDLLRVLPTMETPWFTYRADYDSTSLAFMERERGWSCDAACLLLALPMAEGIEQQRLEVFMPLVRQAAAVRGGSEPSKEFVRQLDELFLSKVAARELVEDWLSGQVNLLRSKEARGRRASSAALSRSRQE